MQVPITELLKGFKKTVIDRSPEILTGVAVAGTVSTAVLASRASWTASEVIYNMESGSEDEGRQILSTEERAREVWKLYIPAVATGTMTVVCIIGATKIGTRRNAALISAYSLTERAFTEYKDKVVEQFGEAKELKVRDSIAEDRVKDDPLGNKQIFITGGGDTLCYETMTGRYFKSDMETLRKAQNDLNAQIINEMYASQNDFCQMIGLPKTGYGEEVGWTTETLLELQFSAILSEDGKPCIAVGYNFTPVRDYYKIN